MGYARHRRTKVVEERARLPDYRLSGSRRVYHGGSAAEVGVVREAVEFATDNVAENGRLTASVQIAKQCHNPRDTRVAPSASERAFVCRVENVLAYVAGTPQQMSVCRLFARVQEVLCCRRGYAGCRRYVARCHAF